MKSLRSLIAVIGISLTSVSNLSASEPGTCESDDTYKLLDFWLGEWTVWSDNEQVGINRIEKILDGCAVMEHWTGSGGGHGKSLFFVDPHGQWQQVWVTQWATRPGGIKQKTRIADDGGRSVRFQGEIHDAERGNYLDRTTLTPIANGQVRQHLEISTDNGANWRTVFDAVYKPVARDP